MSAGRLADAQPAHGVAGEIQLPQLAAHTRPATPRSSPPWTMANRAWSARRAAARQRAGPADAPLGRVADDLRPVGQLDHVVQDHGHVAAQGLLDGHGPLRRDRQQPAVDVRAEDGLLLGHFADSRPG